MQEKKTFTVKESINNYRWFNLKELTEWLLILLVCFCIVYCMNTFAIINANVPSASMEPTIMTNDKIVANRFAYAGNKTPERGDVVIFHYPDYEETLYVKRVIGLPGDTVIIRDGQVYINDILLDEPYLTEETEGYFGPYVVPEGHYFMLGDNRNNSEDSRYWENKYVEESKILGKVMFKYDLTPPRFNKVH